MKILLLFSIIFISCQNDGEDIQYIKSFPNTIALSGEMINVCDELSSAFHIKMIDTLLIGYNDSFANPKGLLSFFSIKNFSHLGSFFSKGKGYGEFYETPTIIINDIKSDGINAIVCAWEVPKLHYVNLNNAIKDKCVTIDTSFTCENPNMNSFILLGAKNDIIYLEYSDQSANSFIAMYNYRNRKMEKVISQSNWDYHDNNLPLSCGVVTLNDDKTKSVKAYLYTDKIEIRDLRNDTNCKILSTKRNGTLKSHDELINTSKADFKMCYLDIACVDSLIIALRFKEPAKVMDGAATVIEVFDINGNPLCLLTTKENLHHFALDMKNKFIYSVVKDQFYRYDIQDMLDYLRK